MVDSIKLKNGLQVVKVRQKDTASATVMLLVPVGSRHENVTNNGISHFLEHLMFKGTTKRPSTLELTKLLDGVGAEYNAYTSKDHTAYYIKVAANHFELALDLFSDMLFNSLFDKTEIDRERGVILEELNMYEDNPLMQVETLMEMSVFNKQHPLGYDIGGLKKNIKKLPRSSFMRFKKAHYFPRNMHLAVAGNLPTNTNQLVRKYFEAAKNVGKSRKPKPFKSYQTKPQFLHKKKATQQTQLSIGFESLPYNHKLLPALSVLSTILGGNMSSRLFIEIRERQGLCYMVRTSVSPYKDTGVFAIQAGLDNQRLEPAVKAIMGELRKVKEELVTDEELTNAKEYIKGQTALQLENSSSQAAWYGKQSVLTGKLISPTVKLEAVDAVTAKQVQRIANQIFVKEHINIATIGPMLSTRKLRSVLDI